MKKSLQKSVAQSLEINSTLIPFVPDLFRGLWALGCSPELVVDLLRPLGLSASSTRILDLGCGKGAVTVITAEELGFQAVGVDACEAFLKEARHKAAEHGVSSLCRFELANLREYVKNIRNFDVTVLATVGSVLGRLDRTIKILRETLRPGGYMIIDEGFFNKKRIPRPGYEHIFTHQETLRQLTALGDRLIQEIQTVEETKRINEIYMSLISENAAALVKRRPTIKDQVEDYVRAQKEECAFMEEYFTGAIWLLQRTDDSTA